MWGRVADLNNHARFKLSRFKGLRAPRWQKIALLRWLQELRYCRYNTVRTIVVPDSLCI